MDLSECISFANENPVTSIATVEGDQPRVRAFAMWFADKTGFYYHTGNMKSIYKQLSKNPKVELCFYKPGEAAGTTMRVTGKVEFLDDKTLEARLYKERPWLHDVMRMAPPGGKLAIFRVAHGEAWFWTMAENMHEAEVPRITF